MSQSLVPARVSPPGRILSRELEARGWTQKDLAEIMGRPHQTVNGIINGNKQITPETAIELANALGTSAEFWTNLEAKYRLSIAQKEIGASSKEGDVSRRSRLYSSFPISEMVKRGWIKSTNSIDDLERQICNFFGIAQIGDPPRVAINCRQSENRESEIQTQTAWVRQVETIARAQRIPSFDPAKLKAAIPEILTCAAQAEDVARVPDKLLALGVHFAIVPHLGKTYLDGAAFRLEQRPVIALTLRYKRVDNFWFTLMHELGHIVAGHEGGYLDNMDDLAVTQEEEEANRLAADWLLAPQALKKFVAETAPHFSAEKIQAFAASQSRHPGILVGRLQHEGLIAYKHSRKFLVKVDSYLAPWID